MYEMVDFFMNANNHSVTNMHFMLNKSESPLMTNFTLHYNLLY